MDGRWRSLEDHAPSTCRLSTVVWGRERGRHRPAWRQKPFIDIVSCVIIYLVLGMMGNFFVCMHRFVSYVSSSYTHLPDQLNAVLLGLNVLIFFFSKPDRVLLSEILSGSVFVA